MPALRVFKAFRASEVISAQREIPAVRDRQDPRETWAPRGPEVSPELPDPPDPRDLWDPRA